MSKIKVAEKTIKLHYNDPPFRSGWYYCAVALDSGNMDADLIYYDSMYDEWQHRGNEKGIICWIEPLDELLKEDLMGRPPSEGDYNGEVFRRISGED